MQEVSSSPFVGCSYSHHQLVDVTTSSQEVVIYNDNPFLSFEENFLIKLSKLGMFHPDGTLNEAEWRLPPPQALTSIQIEKLRVLMEEREVNAIDENGHAQWTVSQKVFQIQYKIFQILQEESFAGFANQEVFLCGDFAAYVVNEVDCFSGMVRSFLQQKGLREDLFDAELKILHEKKSTEPKHVEWQISLDGLDAEKIQRLENNHIAWFGAKSYGRLNREQIEALFFISKEKGASFFECTLGDQSGRKNFFTKIRIGSDYPFTIDSLRIPVSGFINYLQTGRLQPIYPEVRGFHQAVSDRALKFLRNRELLTPSSKLKAICFLFNNYYPCSVSLLQNSISSTREFRLAIRQYDSNPLALFAAASLLPDKKDLWNTLSLKAANALLKEISTLIVSHHISWQAIEALLSFACWIRVCHPTQGETITLRKSDTIIYFVLNLQETTFQIPLNPDLQGNILHQMSSESLEKLQTLWELLVPQRITCSFSKIELIQFCENLIPVQILQDTFKKFATHKSSLLNRIGYICTLVSQDICPGVWGLDSYFKRIPLLLSENAKEQREELSFLATLLTPQNPFYPHSLEDLLNQFIYHLFRNPHPFQCFTLFYEQLSRLSEEKSSALILSILPCLDLENALIMYRNVENSFSISHKASFFFTILKQPLYPNFYPKIFAVAKELLPNLKNNSEWQKLFLKLVEDAANTGFHEDIIDCFRILAPSPFLSDEEWKELTQVLTSRASIIDTYRIWHTLSPIRFFPPSKQMNLVLKPIAFKATVDTPGPALTRILERTVESLPQQMPTTTSQFTAIEIVLSKDISEEQPSLPAQSTPQLATQSSKRKVKGSVTPSNVQDGVSSSPLHAEQPAVQEPNSLVPPPRINKRRNFAAKKANKVAPPIIKQPPQLSEKDLDGMSALEQIKALQSDLCKDISKTNRKRRYTEKTIALINEGCDLLSLFTNNSYSKKTCFPDEIRKALLDFFEKALPVDKEVLHVQALLSLLKIPIISHSLDPFLSALHRQLSALSNTQGKEQVSLSLLEEMLQAKYLPAVNLLTEIWSATADKRIKELLRQYEPELISKLIEERRFADIFKFLHFLDVHKVPKPKISVSKQLVSLFKETAITEENKETAWARAQFVVKSRLECPNHVISILSFWLPLFSDDDKKFSDCQAMLFCQLSKLKVHEQRRYYQQLTAVFMNCLTCNANLVSVIDCLEKIHSLSLPVLKKVRTLRKNELNSILTCLIPLAKRNALDLTIDEKKTFFLTLLQDLLDNPSIALTETTAFFSEWGDLFSDDIDLLIRYILITLKFIDPQSHRDQLLALIKLRQTQNHLPLLIDNQLVRLLIATGSTACINIGCQLTLARYVLGLGEEEKEIFKATIETFLHHLPLACDLNSVLNFFTHTSDHYPDSFSDVIKTYLLNKISSALPHLQLRELKAEDRLELLCINLLEHPNKEQLQLCSYCLTYLSNEIEPTRARYFRLLIIKASMMIAVDENQSSLIVIALKEFSDWICEEASCPLLSGENKQYLDVFNRAVTLAFGGLKTLIIHDRAKFTNSFNELFKNIHLATENIHHYYIELIEHLLFTTVDLFVLNTILSCFNKITSISEAYQSRFEQCLEQFCYFVFAFEPKSNYSLYLQTRLLLSSLESRGELSPDLTLLYTFYVGFTNRGEGQLDEYCSKPFLRLVEKKARGTLEGHTQISLLLNAIQPYLTDQTYILKAFRVFYGTIHNFSYKDASHLINNFIAQFQGYSSPHSFSHHLFLIFFEETVAKGLVHFTKEKQELLTKVFAFFKNAYEKEFFKHNPQLLISVLSVLKEHASVEDFLSLFDNFTERRYLRTQETLKALFPFLNNYLLTLGDSEEPQIARALVNLIHFLATFQSKGAFNDNPNLFYTLLRSITPINFRLMRKKGQPEVPMVDLIFSILGGFDMKPSFHSRAYLEGLFSFLNEYLIAFLQDNGDALKFVSSMLLTVTASLKKLIQKTDLSKLPSLPFRLLKAITPANIRIIQKSPESAEVIDHVLQPFRQEKTILLKDEEVLTERVRFAAYFIEELLGIDRSQTFAYAKCQFKYLLDFMETLLQEGILKSNFSHFLTLVELLIPCNIALIKRELAAQETPTNSICALLFRRMVCKPEFMTAANLKQKFSISNRFAQKLIELGLFDLGKSRLESNANELKNQLLNRPTFNNAFSTYLECIKEFIAPNAKIVQEQTRRKEKPCVNLIFPLLFLEGRRVDEQSDAFFVAFEFISALLKLEGATHLGKELYRETTDRLRKFGKTSDFRSYLNCVQGFIQCNVALIRYEVKGETNLTDTISTLLRDPSSDTSPFIENVLEIQALFANYLIYLNTPKTLGLATLLMQKCASRLVNLLQSPFFVANPLHYLECVRKLISPNIALLKAGKKEYIADLLLREEVHKLCSPPIVFKAKLSVAHDLITKLMELGKEPKQLARHIWLTMQQQFFEVTFQDNESSFSLACLSFLFEHCVALKAPSEVIQRLIFEGLDKKTPQQKLIYINNASFILEELIKRDPTLGNEILKKFSQILLPELKKGSYKERPGHYFKYLQLLVLANGKLARYLQETFTDYITPLCNFQLTLAPSLKKQHFLTLLRQRFELLNDFINELLSANFIEEGKNLLHQETDLLKELLEKGYFDNQFPLFLDYLKGLRPNVVALIAYQLQVGEEVTDFITSSLFSETVTTRFNKSEDINKKMVEVQLLALNIRDKKFKAAKEYSTSLNRRIQDAIYSLSKEQQRELSLYCSSKESKEQ